VVCALANSYVELAAREAGAVAEHMAAIKIDKYSCSLPACYIFEPAAVDNLGTLNSSAVVFLSDLGHRSSSITGNNETILLQRISVAIQRFNATLLRESFVMHDDSDNNTDHILWTAAGQCCGSCGRWPATGMLLVSAA
jgi:hypothetical protein